MTHDIYIIEHDVKKISNNTTVHSYEIKLRGDRVFDLYIDGKWVLSRGSHENILEELKKIMDAEL
jgi:hypothetical protein